MGEYAEYEGALDATGMRIAIVAGRFNDHVTKPLLDGALDDAARRSALDDVPVYWVPGAFEIPLVAQAPRGVGRVRRGDLPRRGDPGRHAALRLRGGGVRGRASRRVVARHRRAGRVRRAHHRRPRPGARPHAAARARVNKGEEAARPRSRWSASSVSSHAKDSS